MSNSINNTASQGNPGVTVITEDTYQTLAAMIRSNDPADHLVAQMILAQVDVQKSIYWIWKLSRINVARMVNLRTKAGRAFRDACSLFYLSNQVPTVFGAWLLRKEWMTDEIYNCIKEELKEMEMLKTQSAFFKYTLELKDDLKHLDPSDSPVTFNN